MSGTSHPSGELRKPLRREKKHLQTELHVDAFRFSLTRVDLKKNLLLFSED